MPKNHPTPEQIADLLDADLLFQHLLDLDLVEDIDYFTGMVTIRCPLGDHAYAHGLSVYVPTGVMDRTIAAYRCLHGECDGRRLLDLGLTVQALNAGR